MNPELGQQIFKTNTEHFISDQQKKSLLGPRWYFPYLEIPVLYFILMETQFISQQSSEMSIISSISSKLKFEK